MSGKGLLTASLIAVTTLLTSAFGQKNEIAVGVGRTFSARQTRPRQCLSALGEYRWRLREIQHEPHPGVRWSKPRPEHQEQRSCRRRCRLGRPNLQVGGYTPSGT